MSRHCLWKIKRSFCRFFIHRDGAGTNCEVSKEVGLALCEAFEQADKVSQKFFIYFFARRFPLFCEKSWSQCTKGRTLGEIKHRLIGISSHCYIKIDSGSPKVLSVLYSYLGLIKFFFSFISKGNFDNAVEILKPIRYKIVKIGGSNAQVRWISLNVTCNV